MQTSSDLLGIDFETLFVFGVPSLDTLSSSNWRRQSDFLSTANNNHADSAVAYGSKPRGLFKFIDFVLGQADIRLTSILRTIP